MVEEDNLVKELNLNCSPAMEIETKPDPPEGDLIDPKTEEVKNPVVETREIVAATLFEESDASEDPIFGSFMKISKIIEQEKKKLEILKEEQEKLKQEMEGIKEEINNERQYFKALCDDLDKTKAIGDDIKKSISITDNLLNEFLSDPNLPDWVRAPFENEMKKNSGLKSCVANNEKQGEEDASKEVEGTVKVDNKDVSDDITKKIMKAVTKDEGNEVMEMISTKVVDGIYQSAAKDDIKGFNYEPDTNTIKVANIEIIDKDNKNIGINVINETQKGAKNDEAPEVANNAEFSELANNDVAPGVANKNDKVELIKEILKEAMISVHSDDSSNNIHSMDKEYIIAQVILQQDNKIEKNNLEYEDKATVLTVQPEQQVNNGNVETSNADEKFDLQETEPNGNIDSDDISFRDSETELLNFVASND